MELKGSVIQGVNIGSRFGVATANLLLEELPALEEGVYLVYVYWPLKPLTKRCGILHFGKRKTFGGDFSAEVHILDFNQDIYGEKITIEVLKFVRSVRKFQNGDQLFTQIEEDVIRAKKFFLRAEIESEWEKLSLSTRQHLAEEALEHLSTLSAFLEAKKIFVYAPQIQREILFVPRLMQQFSDKTYFFPRVNQNDLEFYSVDSYDDLVQGAFGILEPPKEGESEIPGDSSILFLPAVGVDENFQRLGKGGGFYDRFVSKLSSSVQRVVIIPKFATEKEIPVESHDQPVDRIIVCKRY